MNETATHPNFERIFEMLGDTPMPAPFEEYGRAPVFLQDFYMNFKRFVWNDGYLDTRTKAAIAFAVSFYLRCDPWSEFFADRMVKLRFSEAGIDELRAVVATVTMYNTLYKFRDLAGNEGLRRASVGLRGHSLNAAGVGPQLVELIASVISNLSSCHTCTTGHVREALGRSLSEDAITEAVQCAATIVAGCTFLN
jgi:alkyl hydroperoxide reductase subunit D